jgi:hypothetical protein
MPVKNPQEVFLVLLSNARHHTERTANFYREVSQKAENPDVKEALEADIAPPPSSLPYGTYTCALPVS